MNGTSSVFSGDQIFYVMGEGWYVDLPERVLGPFPSRQVAGKSLERHAQQALFKAERYFHVTDQGWFVNTREGERGPFYSRREAERYVGDLVENSRGRRRELW